MAALLFPSTLGHRELTNICQAPSPISRSFHFLRPKKKKRKSSRKTHLIPFHAKRGGPKNSVGTKYARLRQGTDQAWTGLQLWSRAGVTSKISTKPRLLLPSPLQSKRLYCSGKLLSYCFLSHLHFARCPYPGTLEFRTTFAPSCYVTAAMEEVGESVSKET